MAPGSPEQVEHGCGGGSEAVSLAADVAETQQPQKRKNNLARPKKSQINKPCLDGLSPLKLHIKPSHFTGQKWLLEDYDDFSLTLKPLDKVGR